VTTVLATQSLAKRYGAKTALHDVSLTVGAGQVFGVLGPNGSGKTTTLGIVLGVTRATGGSFQWFGAGGGGRERRRLGALLEQPCFYPWLTGAANLGVFAAIKGARDGRALSAVLQQVGLAEARDQPFASYSLGMKQRLAIAVALLGQPEVLVLDEPTNGLDAQGIFDVRALIGAFAKRGGTVILASHMLDEVEKVCDHVAILKGGRILAQGATTSVLASKGWLEVGARDLAALERALAALYPAARVVAVAGKPWLELHDVDADGASVNEGLAARGLFASHLARRTPSLEAQYLGLVGDASGPTAAAAAGRKESP
jgi:ABC-2 type transport system ATP-binding protein